MDRVTMYRLYMQAQVCGVFPKEDINYPAAPLG